MRDDGPLYTIRVHTLLLCCCYTTTGVIARVIRKKKKKSPIRSTSCTFSYPKRKERCNNNNNVHNSSIEFQVRSSSSRGQEVRRREIERRENAIFIGQSLSLCLCACPICSSPPMEEGKKNTLTTTMKEQLYLNGTCATLSLSLCPILVQHQTTIDSSSFIWAHSTMRPGKATTRFYFIFHHPSSFYPPSPSDLKNGHV